MNLQPAFGTAQPVGNCCFPDAIPAQMPVMLGAVIDVVGVLLTAKCAFEGHGGSCLRALVPEDDLVELNIGGFCPEETRQAPGPHFYVHIVELIELPTLSSIMIDKTLKLNTHFGRRLP